MYRHDYHTCFKLFFVNLVKEFIQVPHVTGAVINAAKNGATWKNIFSCVLYALKGNEIFSHSQMINRYLKTNGICPNLLF